MAQANWRPMSILPCSEELEITEPLVANILYEKALVKNPRSYKLWKAYLTHRVRQLKDKKLDDAMFEEVNFCFERSIVFMHKMPRIWINYCQLLTKQLLITKTRRTFDRALEALPITQHFRIWPLYIEFIKSKHVPPETSVRIFKRYMKLKPEDGEDFLDYLVQVGRLDEAAVLLCDIINLDKFQSKYNKTKYQLWNELCEMICKNADQITSLEVDVIIRDGISRYRDQQGHLWNSLAEYYIRLGLFTKARDIYEEALEKVMTIRDFAQVYDAYAQTEESCNERILESLGSGESLDDNDNDDVDLEIRLARYEDLVQRRPLLLNSVALRQNPHNVNEWQKRIKLYGDNHKKVIETYTKALKTIDPKQAVGRYENLWIEFAKFYETHNQLDDARYIFEKATQSSFVRVDDLATIWCQYIEMELRYDNFDLAQQLIQKATSPPPGKTKADLYDLNQPVQLRIFKCLKLWLLYADIEENFGNYNSTKAVYERIIDLRIATPQVIINYASFLEENKYFEESFKAFEKGLSLFRWPNVYEIWRTYVTKFLARYGSQKLERARDLFEQCLKDCPPKYAKEFFLKYAKLEETHGLAKRAMDIYNRSTDAVEPGQRAEMFKIYIRKVSQLFGSTQTRGIYQKAIQSLPDQEAKHFCFEYANLEKGLMEIDNARAIYANCSQMCDPRIDKEFWQTWLEFETKFGNEDTIAEMLRIQRSVKALFPRQVFLSDTTKAITTDDPQTIAGTDQN